jgi:steroid 5-alpha reductase family enzyme
MRPIDETDPIETRARRRVNIKMGFYIHALVFVVVNLGLYAINSAKGGAHWSNLPLLGWGIGLAIHGLVTFINLQGDGMRSRMLAREIERLRRDGR